jgi:hypothetical protein
MNEEYAKRKKENGITCRMVRTILKVKTEIDGKMLVIEPNIEKTRHVLISRRQYAGKNL